MPSSLTRPAPPSAEQLLARLLDEPELVAAVRALPASALGRLVDHVGLEDAGELVALATAEQLRQVLDEDLWSSLRPGDDERFDPQRFARWVEVLLEAGEDLAARKVTELPEELVTLAMNEQVLVLDLDELAPRLSSRRHADDALDKALEGCAAVEFDEYLVVARREEGWDSLQNLLLALDQHHHGYLQRLLARCAQATGETVEEEGGLYEVLSAAETLAADAAAEREDRRGTAGFVTPSSAAAFLALARRSDPRQDPSTERDPLTRAYFRQRRAPAPAPARRSGASTPDGAPGPQSPVGLARLVGLLREAELLLPEAAPAWLLPAPGVEAAATPAAAHLLRSAMHRLDRTEPALHARRLEELAYLANVLVAGCSAPAGTFRPSRAAELAVAVCNLGLQRLLADAAGTVAAADADPDEARAAAALGRLGADRVFRLGWFLLQAEVALPAAQALQRVIARLESHAVDLRAQQLLRRAATTLRSALAAGKPWTASGRLLDDLAAFLDGHTRTICRCLLAECPLLPAVVGDPQPIATAEQLGRARALVGEIER